MKSECVMRIRNIRVHLEIPIEPGESTEFPFDYFTDDRGMNYEISALRDACNEVEEDLKSPDLEENYVLFSIASDGTKEAIGIVTHVEYNPTAACIEVDGVIACGGTFNEYIFTDNENLAVMMHINDFWIG